MRVFARHNSEFPRVSDDPPTGGDPDTAPLAGVYERIVDTMSRAS